MVQNIQQLLILIHEKKYILYVCKKLVRVKNYLMLVKHHGF
jgi:hypothetical protein